MPYKPATPCRKQGCPLYSNDKSGYCDKHKREQQKIQDQERGSSAQRGYDRKWRRARIRYLREHPLCVECLSKGQVAAATVVDHVIPPKGDYELFWDESNWQSLCKFHHDTKTAKEDGAFGNKGGGI